MFIDYSVINPSLTKILIGTEDSIIKLMNHYIKENHKDELHKGLVDFFKVIPKKTVVSIMYGNLLKIISSYEHIKDNLTVVNFCSTLGEDLIRNYYYYKYLNY